MLREVPEGFLVVKKGGRPPKHARDIAVHLAVLWRVEMLREKHHQAHDWAMDTWPALGDGAAVRKSIRKARGVLKGRGQLAMMTNAIMFTRTESPNFVPEGAEVWMWFLGELEALKLRAVNCKTTISWQQAYPSDQQDEPA